MAEERRQTVLSDHDIEKIKGALTSTFADQFTRWCETIGYDVTTQESRSEIRDDHRFIRIFRKSAVWVVATVVGAYAVAKTTGLIG